MDDRTIQRRVPPALCERVAAMLRVTDDIGPDHLDEECRDLARALVGKPTRKYPTPLTIDGVPVGE